MWCCSSRNRSKDVDNLIEAPIEPPTNINSPTDSPPFTEDEIIKLRANLHILIQFVDDSYTFSQNVIGEVYAQLKAGSSPGDKRSLFNELLYSSYELIGAIPFPGTGAVSWFVGALVNTYSDTQPDGVDLDKMFASMVERYAEVTLALRTDLTAMNTNPDLYRDKEYVVPFGDKKTINLRELLNYTLPNPDETVYNDMLIQQRRGLRHSVCKPPFQAMARWGVYYELNTSNPRGFVPARAGGNHGWIIYGNMKDWGKGNELYSNQPLTYFHPEYVKVEVFGEDDDPIQNFSDAGSRFVQAFPAAVIMPQDQNMIIDGETCQGYRHYYILTDYKSNLDFAVADGGFITWLFKDDGFGNITNPEGVGMREEIVREWMVNGDGIPKGIFD